VVRGGSLVVTLEDHFQTGGLYSILAELLLENELTAKVLPLALKERWYKPGLLSEVLEYEGFTGQHIARRIGERLGDGVHSFGAKTKVVENEFAE
jgi:transketolase